MCPKNEDANLKDVSFWEDSQSFSHRAAFSLNYFQPTARFDFVQDGSAARMAHGRVCVSTALNCLGKPNGQPEHLETCLSDGHSDRALTCHIHSQGLWMILNGLAALGRGTQVRLQRRCENQWIIR